MTNADRIRSKSDEELAQLFATLAANTIYLTQERMGVKPTIALEWGTTERAWLEWLRKETSKTDPIIVTEMKEEGQSWVTD